MSRIAGEINAEMMKTTGETQSLTDRMVQEIESLRQQLSDAIFRKESAIDVQESLRQQRAEALAAVKLLRGALLEICNLPNKYPGHRVLRTIEIATAAIIATEPKP